MQQAHEIEAEDSEAGGLARLVANALGSANIFEALGRADYSRDVVDLAAQSVPNLAPT
jgi:hypothetical protein